MVSLRSADGVVARAHNLVARDRQRLDPRLDRDLDLVAPVKRVEEPRLAGVGERDEPEGVGRLVVGGKALGHAVVPGERREIVVGTYPGDPLDEWYERR